MIRLQKISRLLLYFYCYYCIYWYCCYFHCDSGIIPVTAMKESTHTSNYAVILSASKYWFNYRHNTNALLVYQLLKDIGGYTDDNIILMLADDYITNPRNPLKNRIFYKPGVRQQQQWDDHSSILHPMETQIDYRGEDVTVQNFVDVLLGKRQHNVSSLPVFDRTDSSSNILIYITGHGGDQFFKFLDIEEILSDQLGITIQQMYNAKKYNEILLIADTCQAFTMGDKITAPNVIMIGSSLQGQSSYAHHTDPSLGLSIVEKYTYFLMEHIYQNDRTLQRTIQQDMIDPYTFAQQHATIGSTDQYSIRKMNEIPMQDFFYNIQSSQSSTMNRKTSNKKKSQRNDNNNNDYYYHETQFLSKESLSLLQRSLSFGPERPEYCTNNDIASTDNDISNCHNRKNSMTQGDTTTISSSFQWNNQRTTTTSPHNNSNQSMPLLEPNDALFRFMVIGLILSAFLLGRIF